MGAGIDTLARLDVQGFAPARPVPDLLPAWVERAEQASPELRALRARLEIARQEVDKAKAGHKPTLDAVAQWSRSSSDSVTNINSRYDNKTIGLQLTVPLYAGGYVSSTVRQAVAEQERARELLEAARLELGVRVHREFRGMTEGVLRIGALEQAVRSAEQAVLSNQKSFQAGSRTTVDVLNSEQQKSTAQRDLAQARYVYLVSQLRLQALYGGLMGGFVQTVQTHDCVDLLLGQALDGFQILTSHVLPPVGPTALVSRCRARALCTSLTPGARCDLGLSYHIPGSKNVTSWFDYKHTLTTEIP